MAVSEWVRECCGFPALTLFPEFTRVFETVSSGSESRRVQILPHYKHDSLTSNTPTNFHFKGEIKEFALWLQKVSNHKTGKY